MERLRQGAWSHVNALRTSEASMSSFEVLAAIGIKESLPCAVSSGYFKEYDSSDDDDEASDASQVDRLLEYLKKEIKARRRSVESQGTRSIPE